MFLTRTTTSGKEVLDIGPSARARLVIAQCPRSLELELDFLTPGRLTDQSIDPLRFAIHRSSSGPGIEVHTAPAGAKWWMVAGVPRVRGDIFRYARDAIYKHCVRRAGLVYEPQLEFSFYSGWGARSSRRTIGCDGVIAGMQLVNTALCGAAEHAASLCSPGLRGQAARFSPCMRLWAYDAMSRDPSGRIAQAASTAPGVLVLAYALDEDESTRSVAKRLLGGISKGCAINPLLATSIEDYFTLMAERDFGEEAPLARPWLRVRHEEMPERRRLERDQRLLVRRAGPRTAPAYVFLPAPIDFVPEDIPRGVRANARWFRIMKCRSPMIAPTAGQDEAALRALARLASRRFDSIHPPRRGAATAKRRMSDLIQYVLATGKRPSRRTCPKRLLARARGWRLSGESTGGGRIARATVLPEAPGSVFSTGHVTVTPLRTWGECVDEGRQNSNCLGSRSRAPHLMAGERFVYAVQVGSTAINVELARLPNGQLRVNEMAGFRNREVSDVERHALRPWLRSIGVE